MFAVNIVRPQVEDDKRRVQGLEPLATAQLHDAMQD